MDEITLHRAMHRPGTLVDVGAHDGLLTLPFADLPDSRVLAFEPLPPAYARLDAAIRARFGGAVPPHVTLRREALGVAPGEVTLEVPWVGEDAIEQWASMVKDFSAMRRDDARISRVDRYTVPVVTLDSFALADVTAMKVDAEGAEEEVLRGAEATLRRCQPLLSVELEERHRAGCLRSVPAFLAGLGYRCAYWLDGGWHGLETFDSATMQRAASSPADMDASDPYIFTFVFVTAELAGMLPESSRPGLTRASPTRSDSSG
jgi:FkbM family methyltransferase